MKHETDSVKDMASVTKYTNKLILHKVKKIIDVLEIISEDPNMKNELYLIGGTAINLFDKKIPRLSVDIDMDYCETKARPFSKRIIEDHAKTLKAMAADNNMDFYRKNRKSNIKLTAILEFKRYFGKKQTGEDTDNIKLDIVYLYKIPIFKIKRKKIPLVYSNFAPYDFSVKIADKHELWAGKAVATVYQAKTDPAPKEARELYKVQLTVARHLYDLYRLNEILKNNKNFLDLERVRTAFILKGVPRIKGLVHLVGENIRLCTHKHVEEQLIPFLRQQQFGQKKREQHKRIEDLLVEMRWGAVNFLMKVCRPSWSEQQLDFVKEFQEKGKYKPEILFGKSNPQYKQLYNNEYLKQAAKRFPRK